jgi:predicted fused transcriptional regulator/phosphomethylpyrimidine kinase
MLIKIVENEKYIMTDDFKRWIKKKKHKDDIFKVKQEVIGYDGNPAYILYKVSFRVSKHFTKIILDNMNRIYKK